MRHLHPGFRGLRPKTRCPDEDAPPAAPPRKTAPFASDDEILEGARAMFRARKWRIERESSRRKGAHGGIAAARRLEAAWNRSWHARLDLTPPGTSLGDKMKGHGLNPREREVLAALVLSQLGLLDSEIGNCSEVPEAIGVSGIEEIQVLRALDEEGRLVASSLVALEDPDEDLPQRSVAVSPELVDSVYRGARDEPKGWPVSNEDELRRKMSLLTFAFKRRADAIGDRVPPFVIERALQKANRNFQRQMTAFERTLQAHKDWKLAGFMSSHEFEPGEKAALLVLLGKDLAHVSEDDSLFTGDGVAQAVSESQEEVIENRRLLCPNSRLLKQELIQAYAGSEESLLGDPRSVAGVEFELTAKGKELLGLEPGKAKRLVGALNLREPTMRLDQLVLGEKVREALKMALTQARQRKALMDNWGLGEVFPYGRGATLLFTGDPGTGKTATAEALAKELGKPILVADYSRIQNCFVGMTEKNIVRTFREARAHDAVLFWDEADAMFFDRDAAERTWEVRDVNVLLQELERFDGVCILATNRRVSLDKALERRIGLKVEFERPGREARRAIWGKLIPAKMPLAEGVDLDRLSEAELTGGEIRNAVLNAARRAMARGGEAERVGMEDFEEAVRMETGGKWTGKGGPIGFTDPDHPDGASRQTDSPDQRRDRKR
jgi:hypothetical protein